MNKHAASQTNEAFRMDIRKGLEATCRQLYRHHAPFVPRSINLKTIRMAASFDMAFKTLSHLHST